MADDNEEVGGPITLEEIEQQLAAEEAKENAPPPEEPKKEDDSPWQAALRISEEARQRAEQELRTRATPQQQVAVSDPVEELSDEQIAKIFEEQGQVAGIRAVQAQTFKIAEKHLEKRLSGMHGTSATLAESTARSQYPMEFELFGKEIQEQIDQLPKEALANPENWKNLIAYVRGRDGNVQRYVEKLQASMSDKASSVAREEQRQLAGAHAPSGSGGRSTASDDAGHYGLDPLEREIADKLGQSYKDYAKWKKI